MKKIASSVLAILIAFSLSACYLPPEGSNSPLLHEHQYVLDSGRTVTCITYRSSAAGGVSCDWGGAR